MAKEKSVETEQEVSSVDRLLGMLDETKKLL